MKKLKTIISSLLGLTFLCGAAFSVAGCGDSGGDGKKTVVNYTSDPDQGIDRTKKIGNLTENSVSDYKILIPTGADESIRYAASELQKYVYQTSGAKLPIVDDSHAQIFVAGKYVSLGETLLRDVAAFKVDYDRLNDDGFVIKTKQNSVYITGARNSSILYGVYDFCERILGTRFLTNDYTYIEERENVELYYMDRTEIPAFSNRFYYAEQTMKQLEFVTKQKQNPVFGGAKKRDEKFGDGGLNSYYNGMLGHTVISVIMKDKSYLSEHADWFADSSGRELCYTNGITADGKLDTANPDSMAMEMLRLCKQYVMNNTTNADTIFIGQEDNSIWCECDDCADSDGLYGKSGTLLRFINVIAEELEEWNEREKLGRKITVETFAYWKTLDPPGFINKKGVWEPVVKARENVAVQIAWMGCGTHALNETCNANLSHKSCFDRWQLCADNLTIWDYATNFSHHFFWYENFDSLAKNYKYYLDIGVTRVMTQGAPHVSNYYQGHLENYVVAKLLWNPWYDVNELINEFNYYYYGAASYQVINEFVQYMRAYYKLLDQNATTGFHTELYTHGYFLNGENYTMSFLTGAVDMIQKEIDRVRQDDMLSEEEKTEMVKRLWQAQIQPEYMLLHNYEFYYDPVGKRDFAKALMSKIDALNIRYYSEGGSIASLKTALGIS